MVTAKAGKTGLFAMVWVRPDTSADMRCFNWRDIVLRKGFRESEI
jgi:hypothetical protein